MWALVDELLRKHGITSKNGCKLIGGCQYVHKSNLSPISNADRQLIETTNQDLFRDCDFIKVGDKNISYITVESMQVFEPVITRIFTVDKHTQVRSLRTYKSNKPIYHHAWCMFPSNTDLIDIRLHKLRSLWWKLQINSNKKISSKIGYSTYWEHFISSLPDFIPEHPPEQTASSKNTSINQSKLPLGITIAKSMVRSGDVVIDYGCGKFKNSKEAVEFVGGRYVGFDPFNGDFYENVFAKILLNSGSANIVVCSNVLNVIKESSVVSSIANELVELARASGTIVVITVYEGDRSGNGKLVKQDQYQRNEKTDTYMKLFQVTGVSAIKKSNTIVVQKGM